MVLLYEVSWRVEGEANRKYYVKGERKRVKEKWEGTQRKSVLKSDKNGSTSLFYFFLSLNSFLFCLYPFSFLLFYLFLCIFPTPVGLQVHDSLNQSVPFLCWANKGYSEQGLQ